MVARQGDNESEAGEAGDVAMPIHDWTKVDPGIWHHFHHKWIAEIADALNGGRMPRNYYALAEQKAGPFGPDILALQARVPPERNGTPAPTGYGGGTAVLTAPPKTRFALEETAPPEEPAESAVTIRHKSGDRIVAIIELISPGNKSSDESFNAVVTKIQELLRQNINLVVVDLFPPPPKRPQGFHAEVWRQRFGKPFASIPKDKPLSAVAYESGPRIRIYGEPLAVGDSLPDMPAFLEPGHWVPVPLDETYTEAYRTFPERWKEELEALPK